MSTDWRALCAELANTLERAQKALRFEGGCSDATDNKRRALINRMADELDYYRQLLTDDRREVHALAVEARATLEHLAAELTVAGHQSAAAWVMAQLRADVIELRPRTEEPA